MTDSSTLTVVAIIVFVFLILVALLILLPAKMASERGRSVIGWILLF